VACCRGGGPRSFINASAIIDERPLQHISANQRTVRIWFFGNGIIESETSGEFSRDVIQHRRVSYDYE